MAPVLHRGAGKTGQLRRKRAFYVALKAVAKGSKARKFAAKITKYDRLLAQEKEDRWNKEQHSQLERPVLSGIWPLSIATDPNETVKVSIVIPVYNQIEYTLGCLRSLQNHKTIHRLEVIVVDDCSNDATQSEINQISWVRYLRQIKNGGFIESCNAGARQARGEFVLFLNNDTEVLDGWLDELVETFSAFPNAGLVGSKLLYPDGSLQEAGGIMWRDGSAWNYGRNQDPRRPEFCYARKVDYCSGASVMVKNELFKRLGGFDLHFAPAYCEDSDLAMRIREAGHDVVYQPLSKLVHFEGVTSGTDVGAGVKAYQVTNTKKLSERWKDRLSLRPENAQDPYDAKDFGLTKRVLVIDHITPEPDQDAGSVDCMEFMRTLQLLGYQVSFIPETNFADVEKYTAALQRVGIEALYHPYVKDVKSHLEEHGHRYQAIVVYRVGILKRCLRNIRTFAPQARLIYQTADLHHLRQQREAELFGDSAQLRKAEATKTEELNLVLSSDCTIVHSTYEKSYLEELVPSAQVEVINWILEPKGTEVGFEQRKGIMFLGGYRHSPNVDAVHYFLNEIWPLVQKNLPDAILYVVGSHLPEELLFRATKSVIMMGYVEDLQTIMDSCRLSIVPLRFGAGTKGKLAMSLAYGLPAITTSIGAEGMALNDGDGVFITDNNQEFADRIISLHESRDTWEHMSCNAISYVKENLSVASGKATILRALGHTVNEKP